MTGKRTGSASWEAIAAVKNRLSIPVIANGNIESYEDVMNCLEVECYLVLIVFCAKKEFI
jgi:tRNA-dihydrouridine synthase